MTYFCTLFDSAYLSRGMVMLESLHACMPDAMCVVFAFDDLTQRVLRDLDLPGVTVVGVKDLENDRLLGVKSSRSKAEYCWTSTPWTVQYVLDKTEADSCTYIDADLFFYSDPGALLAEAEGSSVLITEHRYTPRYDMSALSGTYCVQFIRFGDDEHGREALVWWRDRCIEWCYDREEDGKFGDQKYLDDWTTRFRGVHVLQHIGGGVAPWNVQQYGIRMHEDRPFILDGRTDKGVPLVFYHFHSVRLYDDGTVDLGNYSISDEVRSLIYVPYLNELMKAGKRISGIAPGLDPHGIRQAPHLLSGAWNRLKRSLKGNYSRISLHELTRRYTWQGF